SKAQAKKVKTRFEDEKRKEKALAEREEKDQLQREENLKKAKEITITEDASLPKAKV
ncbi:unnamed protein product, partial [Rotaria magnacalcarata]